MTSLTLPVSVGLSSVATLLTGRAAPEINVPVCLDLPVASLVAAASEFQKQFHNPPSSAVSEQPTSVRPADAPNEDLSFQICVGTKDSARIFMDAQGRASLRLHIQVCVPLAPLVATLSHALMPNGHSQHWITSAPCPWVSNDVLRRLRSKRWIDKSEALQTLSENSAKGDVQAIEAVCSCLNDKSQPVRIKSLRALAIICEKGNRHAINSVVGLLHDINSDVRNAARITLSQLVEKGDQQTISALVDILHSGNSEARRVAACTALGQIVERSDLQSIGLLHGLLHDNAALIRVAACNTLSQIVASGDQEFLAVLAPLLQDRSDAVRSAVCVAMGERAEKGDQTIITKMAGCLKDGDAGVQRAAAKAITQLGGKGNPHTIAEVIKALDGGNERTKDAAVRTLAQVAERGNEDAITALSPLLSGDSTMVRLIAAEALVDLMDIRNEVIKAFIELTLHDQAGTSSGSSSRGTADLSQDMKQYAALALSTVVDKEKKVNMNKVITALDPRQHPELWTTWLRRVTISL